MLCEGLHRNGLAWAYKAARRLNACSRRERAQQAERWRGAGDVSWLLGRATRATRPPTDRQQRPSHACNPRCPPGGPLALAPTPGLYPAAPGRRSRLTAAQAPAHDNAAVQHLSGGGAALLLLHLHYNTEAGRGGRATFAPTFLNVGEDVKVVPQ